MLLREQFALVFVTERAIYHWTPCLEFLYEARVHLRSFFQVVSRTKRATHTVKDRYVHGVIVIKLLESPVGGMYNRRLAPQESPILSGSDRNQGGYYESLTLLPEKDTHSKSRSAVSLFTQFFFSGLLIPINRILLIVSVTTSGS